MYLGTTWNLGNGPGPFTLPSKAAKQVVIPAAVCDGHGNMGRSSSLAALDGLVVMFPGVVAQGIHVSRFLSF